MQRELVAVWKEETRNLVFDGFGEIRLFCWR